jgi:hypothetical protein
MMAILFDSAIALVDQLLVSVDDLCAMFYSLSIGINSVGAFIDQVIHTLYGAAAC